LFSPPWRAASTCQPPTPHIDSHDMHAGLLHRCHHHQGGSGRSQSVCGRAERGLLIFSSTTPTASSLANPGQEAMRRGKHRRQEAPRRQDSRNASDCFQGGENLGCGRAGGTRMLQSVVSTIRSTVGAVPSTATGSGVRGGTAARLYS